MMEQQRALTCIVCPRGCGLHAIRHEDGSVTVTGNSCPGGEQYAAAELTHPVRTLTTTVCTADGSLLSVRTDRPIPKELLSDAMRELNRLVVTRAADFGDTVLSDLLGTGANVISTGRWKAEG